MKSQVREFPKNAYIFKEGCVGNAAFILTEGKVEISVQVAEKKTIMAVIEPISVFGEMALLLKDQKRTASAQALTASKVAEISRRDFDDYIGKSSPLITAVLNALVMRLQKTTTHVAQHPDLFLGIAEIIHLLQQHHPRPINREALIQSLSKAFLQPVEEIIKVLDFMETLGLIEQRIDGANTFLEEIKKSDFPDRCRKIHASFAKL